MKVWLVGEGWDESHDAIVGVFTSEALAEEKADSLMAVGEWSNAHLFDESLMDGHIKSWNWRNESAGQYVWVEEWEL